MGADIFELPCYYNNVLLIIWTLDSFNSKKILERWPFVGPVQSLYNEGPTLDYILSVLAVHHFDTYILIDIRD